VPWGRKKGGVNRSVAERQLARATEQHARARRNLEVFLSQKFRRQRRQAREIVKSEAERLLAEHEEQRRRLRLLPLSPEQREAVTVGFRQRVAVPSDDGSMPWSDVQVLQDRLREADDALERAQAEAAEQKRSIRLGRSVYGAIPPRTPPLIFGREDRGRRTPTHAPRRIFLLPRRTLPRIMT
jgi:hypothetical protein